MRSSILNQPIDIVSMDEAYGLSMTALIQKQQFKIITLNPEMVVKALNNSEFQSALNNAHLVVPDGTGILWGLKLLNGRNLEKPIERIPGIELAEKILETANELSKRVAIFGGTKEVIEKVSLVIKEKCSKINLVKAINGYINKENYEKVALEIAQTNPDVVFVALGTPRQEIWISKYSHLFPNSVMIGIGGSLDVWAGKKPRAPRWVRDIHLEWLFRLLIDPKRIPRVLVSLPQFMWKVFISSLQTKQAS